MFTKLCPSLKYSIPKAYKNLISDCWSHKPSKRPSFDEIVNQLANDSEFITEMVDEDIFYDYVDYINEFTISFEYTNRIMSYTEFINNRQKRTIESNSESDDKNYKKRKDIENYVKKQNQMRNTRTTIQRKHSSHDEDSDDNQKIKRKTRSTIERKQSSDDESNDKRREKTKKRSTTMIQRKHSSDDEDDRRDRTKKRNTKTMIQRKHSSDDEDDRRDRTKKRNTKTMIQRKQSSDDEDDRRDQTKKKKHENNDTTKTL